MLGLANKNMSKFKTLACPFCGGKKSHLDEYEGEWFRNCLTCGESMRGRNRKKATEYWNKRVGGHETDDETGTTKKIRPTEGQRIKCFGRNERLIGEGIYHNARIVKNHSRAFVSLDDGFWASWNSVKRWVSAEPANAPHEPRARLRKDDQ
jgi:hypothetical protein